MKNDDKHRKLDRFEIRNFLATAIQEMREPGVPARPSAETVAYYNGLIADNERRLAACLRIMAIRELIKGQGWDTFDDSDIVEDFHRDTYFYFVGTEAEFDEYKKGGKEDGKN